MPLPTPSSGESEDEFISRCMADDTASADFPDEDQRLAVCFGRWRDQRSDGSREMKTLDTAFEVKQVDNFGQFAGYASVFDEVDFVQDAVQKGAFQKTISRHREKGRMPALLWQHDTSEPIGVWEKMSEDDHGLYVEGKLFTDDIPRAKQAHALLKHNGLSGLSIGYRVVDDEINEKTRVRELKELDLLEVSLVTFPALDVARVNDVKYAIQNGDVPSPRNLERFLRDAGFSRSQAKAFVAEGHKGLRQRDADDDLEQLAHSLKQRVELLSM